MYTLRDFDKHTRGLVIDESLSEHRMVNLAKDATIDGYFVDTPRRLLIIRPPFPTLVYDNSMVPLDESVDLRLSGGAVRKLLIAKNGKPLSEIDAPEPKFPTEDPYEVEDFYAWLVGRLATPETREALLASVGS